LDLSAGLVLGRVVQVDSSCARVELSDPETAARVTVSDLVALGARGDEYSIGLVEAAMGETEASIRAILIGTFHPATEAGPAAFTRGSGVHPHIGSECWLIEGELLGRFMSLLGEGVSPGERLALGQFVADHAAPAIADGNRLFQRHAALLGTTGAGKSWAVATILERAGRLKHPNLIVFDMHGEYLPLAQAADGRQPLARRLSIAGPTDVPSPDDHALFLPYWMLSCEEVLALTLDPTDPHVSTQTLRFAHHVQRLKEATLRDVDREDALRTFTADSPVPYRLEHLLSWLVRDDTEKIPQHPSGKVEPGPYAGRLTGLISRLEARMADPRYGFIFSPPDQTLEYDWLTEAAASLLDSGPERPGIKVIDFSEVPSGILPLVAGVLARLIYNVQLWIDPAVRTPVCVVCDEAHLYLPVHAESGPVQRAALETFEAIAKEGRKYGIALLVVSQRPADISRTILSQCNNFIVMRLTSDEDQAVVERLVPETLGAVTSILPLLDVGEAVVLGDALLLPTRLKFDAPTLRPTSATQPFWTKWGDQGSSRSSIAAGVEALRNQLRASPVPD
jgi:DNA helicase HerA-like ATPase